jgi:hypothetical protein
MIVTLGCSFGNGSTGDLGTEGANPDILFQDDFSDNTGDWYTYIDDNGITDYESEGFRIHINEPNAYHWTNPSKKFTDTRIEVEATKLSGPEGNDFGIICRYQDDNNFYFFTISSDGYFAIAKLVDGVETLIGKEELGFDEVTINSGETTNLIRADCKGSSLTLYANGKQLSKVQDTEFTSGDIGLIASTYEESGTDILFDNLIVRVP